MQTAVIEFGVVWLRIQREERNLIKSETSITPPLWRAEGWVSIMSEHPHAWPTLKALTPGAMLRCTHLYLAHQIMMKA